MAQRPAQTQPYPGETAKMRPRPRDEMRDYAGRDLLAGKRALITGGDSGIGRAVAIAFAKEGADVAITYLSEDADAAHTAKLVEAEGRRCVTLRGDLADEQHCVNVVARTVDEFGGIDVLVHHAGVQQPVDDIRQITTDQLVRTFQVNVFSMFWLTQAALPHVTDGGAIILTGSITGLRGNPSMMDYAASKAAVMNLTYSLSRALMDRDIRVNCVAPGPVWTPMIPATIPDPEKVASFGEQAPMGRAADPDEIAPSYVFFASDRLSSYYTGEIISPAGGEVHPG